MWAKMENFTQQKNTALSQVSREWALSLDADETLTPELAKYIERQKQRGFANIKEFEVEYWKRGASSFATFILTLIGVSISARKRKNGMGIALGIGLALILSYIMFQTVSSTFAVNANMHPALAAWLPNIIFSFIAFYFYKKAPR